MGVRGAQPTLKSHIPRFLEDKLAATLCPPKSDVDSHVRVRRRAVFMRPRFRAVLSFLVVSLLAGLVLSPIDVWGRWLNGSTQPSDPRGPLSPYWGGTIQRWETLIAQEATRRGLDPDFLAALIWTESSGDPDAVGPAGAVGLMQVMPKEAGFTWRPTQQELLDPSTNLFWGARTLSTVIHQGKGDLLHALAAYNGGWEQATYGVPQRFAANVMRDYAASVVQRHGVQGRWIAFFAVWNATAHGPIWVADSERQDVYFYGQSNWVPEGGALIPLVPPAAVVAQCLDETTGQSYAVGLWVYATAQNWWVGTNESSYLTSGVSTPLVMPPVFGTPTGTLYPTSTYAPTSTPLATATPEFSPTPAATDTPTATTTPTPTPTVTASPTPTEMPLSTPLSPASPTLSPTQSAATTAATPSPTPSPTPTPSATSTVVATPTPASVSGAADAIVLQDGAELRPGATRWWDPVEVLVAGVQVRLLGQDPAYPDWVYISTMDGKLSGWTKRENLDIKRSLSGVPAATPQPTLTASPTPSPTFTPVPTPTPKPAIACNGYPLYGEAWQTEKYGTVEGWTAVIFARGYEGTCSYTYYWNTLDNPIAGPTNGTVFFEVYSTEPRGDIVGSVIISDGVETVTVGVFITSPFND